MRTLALAAALLFAGCAAKSTGSSSTGTGGSGSTSGSGTSTGSTGAGTSTGSTGTTGDTYLPWSGGPSYYARWAHGPSSDPGFFPIAVWLQQPRNAARYRALGINTFVGLWEGPTTAQISDLGDAGVPVVCDQAVDWQANVSAPAIEGWQQQDEPDNAQPDGSGGYGPCVPPSDIQQVAAAFKANDPTRPVYLNLGQGAAWADYYGRGSACAGVDDYADYAMGADILSFDIYPVNSTDAPVAGDLSYVAKGVDHLRLACGDAKPVWTWIETTGINDPARTPTPAQIRAEVWMALIHGARGVGYFAHILGPTFDETGLLDTQSSKQAVLNLDAQIVELAPVLDTRSLANGATVVSSNGSVTVDLMAKRAQGKLYVFTVAMRDAATTATFTVRTPTQGAVTVLGEARTLPLTGGTFSDHFDGYAVHLYEIAP